MKLSPRPTSAPARRTIVALALAAATVLAGAAPPDLPSPEATFGFQMGADGRLAGWPEIQRYFETVAQASDRVALVDAGPTTEGRRLIAAIVSAPANISRLDAIRDASLRLADPRGLTEEDARTLAADQKVIVAIGCSIHATEVGASQMANELLFELATSDDPALGRVLEDVVVILFPSLNPDGHALVVEWFERTRGTGYQTAPMPWLYHNYAGHDLNRDAFMLNMQENRSLARFFYREWHPQVFLTLHQMGPKGPRFFVPPNYEPIDPNYDPIIWREAGLLGHAMALELERRGRQGVVSNALFDYYWPGYEDSAPLGHNVVCLLTEAASAQLAWPMTIEAAELTGATRGLPEYRPRLNFPNPWPGGLWRLRDIVEYELDAVRGLLDATARYRETLVWNFYLMGRRAVEAGERGGPFAFIVPPDQHDPHAAATLLNLLIDAGVEAYRAEEPYRADGNDQLAGSTIIPMAQPFRAYAKTLLERQDYPTSRTGRNDEIEPPYDVAGWTLPYQMGVETIRVERTFALPMMAKLDRAVIPPARVWGERRASYFVIEARGNGGAIAANRLMAAKLQPSWTLEPLEEQGYRYPAGSLLVQESRQARAVVEQLAATLGLRATGVRGRLPAARRAVAAARIGLYRPWVENTDEGWTRWLLERYEFPFTTVRDERIRAGTLNEAFDAIVLPASPAERLVEGHPSGSVPPEYAGGLGQEGVAALESFVRAGGTLVCLDASCELVRDLFSLPLVDVTRETERGGPFAPGSILRLEVDPTEPLGFGMPQETAAFFAFSAAYREATERAATNGPAEQPAIRVVARYGARDLLLSGWLDGEHELAGQAAVVDAAVGQGRVVVIGFRAQHRGQSHATFRLLFNALLTTHPGQAASH